MKVWTIATAGVLLLAGCGGGGSEAETEPTLPKQDRYMAKLETEGLDDEFVAPRQAVTNAKNVCESIDNGAEPEGTAADEIGVRFYCAEYANAFKVVETKTVMGTFRLTDSSFYDKEVKDACWGSGGFSDIEAGLGVVVRNNDGEVLARTELEEGQFVGSLTCRFGFAVELTEGEDAYMVEVGNRGEISSTWDDISTTGFQITLG